MTVAVEAQTEALWEAEHDRLGGLASGVSIGLLLAAGGMFALAYGMVSSNRTAGHAIFWVAGALIVASFVVAVAAPDVSRATLFLLVELDAAVLFLPKVFRSPSGFNFYDELQHLRATEQVVASKHVLVSDPLNPVVGSYPGIHVATAMLSKLSGLSLFVSGQLILVVAHCLALGAVFLLADRFLGSRKIAALAAFIYGCNPAFLFFDAQFSYESLALPIAIAILAVATWRPQITGRRSMAVLLPSAIMTAALVLTHHITAYALVIIIALFALSLYRFDPAWRPLATRLSVLLVITLVAIGVWLAFAAPHTWRYLGPQIRENLLALPNFLTGQTVQSRASANVRGPEYETVAAFAGLAVLAITFCAGFVHRFRHRPHERGRIIPLGVIGLVFFASLPVAYVVSDAGTIARTWEFSYLGLAPLSAVAIVALVGRKGTAALLASFGALFLILVLGTTARSGENIRFPGPYVANGGPRSATAETVAAARWLRRTYGPNWVVMGDITLAATFDAYGQDFPATYQNYGFRPWQVIESRKLTSRALYELNRSFAGFVVVDERASKSVPFEGFYFSPSEPRPTGWQAPMPQSFLTKFDHDPRFRRVYDNGVVRVYRFLPGGNGFS